jgi:hypothetical protein
MIRVLLVPTLLLVTICSGEERVMLSAESWQSPDGLVGLTIDKDYVAVQKERLKRHPMYFWAGEAKPLSDAEAEAYGALNERLHQEMGRVSKEHFADTPIPKELQDNDHPWFTPFTYQNYDWYGPSYECYIVVIGKYIDSSLIKRFQTLLTKDHRDWCIQVVVSESFEFESGHEIAIFSDQVILQAETAATLGIPTDRQCHAAIAPAELPTTECAGTNSRE